MANPKIKSGTTFTFVIIRNATDQKEPKPRMVIFKRRGADGPEAREEGQDTEELVVVSVRDQLDIPAARAAFVTYKNIIGKLATLTDQHGTATTKLLVMDVRNVPGYPLKTPGGIGGGMVANSVVVEKIEWRFHATEVDS